MADPKVRVRMYRPGLGDCFLVTVTKGRRKSNVLIDCGRFQGSEFQGVDWPDIVGDIEKESRGKLDAVAITHEHSDHISGFHDHLEQFRAMATGELWLAWTEDPKQRLLSEKKALQGLREVSGQLNAAAGDGPRATGGIIREMLGFSPRTDREFEEIKDMWPRDRRHLFNPGAVIEREWLQGVRVHVLGPPRDKKLMNKDRGVSGVEMYPKLAAFAALGGAVPGLRGRDASPFDEAYCRPRDTACGSYLEKRQEWRTIDEEWLGSLQRMALQYVNGVNNTSLVLAFELPESGKVLLFVGDAQIGNWQSWAVPRAELLKRVVFYKCGHHGSHNATLKQDGLEAMPKGIQVAIPTNERFALGQGPSPWVMPAAGITEAMKKRRDKVRRADERVNKAYIDFSF